MITLPTLKHFFAKPLGVAAGLRVCAAGGVIMKFDRAVQGVGRGESA